MMDMLASIDAGQPRKNEGPVDCLLSLLTPENDSAACQRRRMVGGTLVLRSLFELKAIKLEQRAGLKDISIAVNNLAKALGAR